MTDRLRNGRRVPIHLYVQRGAESSDHDEPVGVVWDERWARRVVAAVNSDALRDAEDYASSLRADLTRAEAAIAKVRELHHPLECVNAGCPQKSWCAGCDPDADYECSEHPWPCPTIHALGEPRGDAPTPAPSLDEIADMSLRAAEAKFGPMDPP